MAFDSLRSSLGKLAQGAATVRETERKPDVVSADEFGPSYGYFPKPLREGKAEDWTKPILCESDPKPLNTKSEDQLLPFMRALHTYPVGQKVKGRSPKNHLNLVRAAQEYNLRFRGAFKISIAGGYVERVKAK